MQIHWNNIIALISLVVAVVLLVGLDVHGKRRLAGESAHSPQVSAFTG